MDFAGARYHKYVGRCKIGAKQSFTCKNRLSRNKIKYQKVCSGQIKFLIELFDNEFGVDLNNGFVSFTPHDKACDFYATNSLLEALPKRDVLKKTSKTHKQNSNIIMLNERKRAIRSDKNKSRKSKKSADYEYQESDNSDWNYETDEDEKINIFEDSGIEKTLKDFEDKVSESEEIDQENMQIDKQISSKTNDKNEETFDKYLDDLQNALQNLVNHTIVDQTNSIDRFKKCKEKFDRIFGHFYSDQLFRSKYDQITVLESVGLIPIKM